MNLSNIIWVCRGNKFGIMHICFPNNSVSFKPIKFNIVLIKVICNDCVNLHSDIRKNKWDDVI